MAAAPSAQPAPLGRKVWLALVAMALAVFVIANDVTAMAVALPDIEADFDADVSTVQWVINAYAVIFGVLIVTGGRLADMFGRRRLFFIGSAIFAGFSLLGALAPGVLPLIVARALMGVGGAMMWPAVLGMTFAVLPASRAGLAGGIVLGAAGFGNAAGPLIGGVLTDTLSWRAILFLNVPIAAVACLATWRFIVESRETGVERSVDYAGVLSLSIGLVALLVALDQGTDLGWTNPYIIAMLCLCVLLLLTFATVERRGGERALLPPDVLGNPQFRAVCVAVLCTSVVFFASLLYLPQFMQKILGWSPLVAGAGLLPMMGMFGATSFIAGRLYEKVGGKRIVTAGAVCLVVGAFLIARIDPSSSWLFLVPGMVLLGIGVGLFLSSATTAGVTSLSEARSSLAGGIIYMCQIAGGSLGLALTTTVFTVASDRSLASKAAERGVDLTSTERDSVQGILAGTESAQQVVERLSSSAAAQVESLVRDAFATGLRWGFAFVMLAAVVGLVVTVAKISGPPSALWHREKQPAKTR